MRSRLLTVWSLPASTPYTWFLDKPSLRRSVLVAAKRPDLPELTGVVNQPFWRLASSVYTPTQLVVPSLLYLLYGGIALSFLLRHCFNWSVRFFTPKCMPQHTAASAPSLSLSLPRQDSSWVLSPAKLALLIAPLEIGVARLGSHPHTAILLIAKNPGLRPLLAPFPLTHRPVRITSAAALTLHDITALPQSNLSQHSAYSRGLLSQYRRDLDRRSVVRLSARYHLYLNTQPDLLRSARIWVRGSCEKPVSTPTAPSIINPLSSAVTLNEQAHRPSARMLQPALAVWTEGRLTR